mmetsp:Transcript_21837/g.42470  ORF Transcript_21837/g.42470 Transcript_21837/m.42470 type:complete len:227 (-) Transcript_21837:114-794(-)
MNNSFDDGPGSGSGSEDFFSSSGLGFGLGSGFGCGGGFEIEPPDGGGTEFSSNAPIALSLAKKMSFDDGPVSASISGGGSSCFGFFFLGLGLRFGLGNSSPFLRASSLFFLSASLLRCLASNLAFMISAFDFFGFPPGAGASSVVVGPGFTGSCGLIARFGLLRGGFLGEREFEAPGGAEFSSSAPIAASFCMRRSVELGPFDHSLSSAFSSPPLLVLTSGMCSRI